MSHPQKKFGVSGSEFGVKKENPFKNYQGVHNKKDIIL